KALIKIERDTYLQRIARIARVAGVSDVVVVVGRPYGREVGDHARELGLNVIVNALPERGMASSVALGFAALEHYESDSAWLWPVDHPAVQVETLNRLIAGLGTHEVAQPQFAGRGGHPPLVARRVWPRLAACGSFEGGARAVFAKADVVRVDVDDQGVLRDVDTPANRAGHWS
nr:NTP transferase domain-containing protein [Deltaproteobacteria bacterium]